MDRGADCGNYVNSFLDKKIRKLKLIYQEHGFVGALLFSMNFLIAKTGWFHDKWFFGRLVEFRGNVVHLNGCRFRLDSPLFTTAFKSRFILGRYERKERRVVRRWLNPSLPVIELGGSIGVVACITNKKLTHPEKHVVVEANPQLIPLLAANRDLNACSFRILNKALGYAEESMIFYAHERFSSGGTTRVTDRPISVSATTLAEIFADAKFEHANLICDIEGAEVELIAHELETISKKVFQFIVEVHPSIVGEEAIHHLRIEIEAVGFRRIRTSVDPYGDVLIFENTNITSSI